MSSGKETEGILYRHFTIMNRELENVHGLIKELDSKVKQLQQALESLESKTSGEDSHLMREIEKSASEMTNLNNELRKDHETLARNVTDLDGRLAEGSKELTQLKTGFEKELAPFVAPGEKIEPETKNVADASIENAKEKFIADIEAAADPEVEEIAETIESDEERKKRKRK